MFQLLSGKWTACSRSLTNAVCLCCLDLRGREPTAGSYKINKVVQHIYMEEYHSCNILFLGGLGLHGKNSPWFEPRNRRTVLVQDLCNASWPSNQFEGAWQPPLQPIKVFMLSLKTSPDRGHQGSQIWRCPQKHECREQIAVCPYSILFMKVLSTGDPAKPKPDHCNVVCHHRCVFF